MQTKTQLIFNDLYTVCILGLIIFEWNQGKRFWMYLFVYFFIKQIIAHKEYYKLNNRLF